LGQRLLRRFQLLVPPAADTSDGLIHDDVRLDADTLQPRAIRVADIRRCHGEFHASGQDINRNVEDGRSDVNSLAFVDVTSCLSRNKGLPERFLGCRAQSDVRIFIFSLLGC
jgi:hypothetical protein